VQEILEEDPELYISEVRDKIFERTFTNASMTSVHRMMKSLCFTRKKIDKHAEERYTEYNTILRDEFLAKISLFAKEDLCFVDESGIHLLLLLRLFGYTRRGRRYTRARQYLKGKKLNLLSAIDYTTGLVAYRITGDNTTTTDFNAFLIEQVVPRVRVGGAIVLDNASIHHCYELQAAVEMMGRHLIFLPPYSPIYNPIELSYGFIKGQLRKIRAEISPLNLVPALQHTLHSITPTLTQSWFKKCMYL